MRMSVRKVADLLFMLAIRSGATIAVELRINDVSAQQVSAILYTDPEFPQGVFVTWLESKGV